MTVRSKGCLGVRTGDVTLDRADERGFDVIILVVELDFGYLSCMSEPLLLSSGISISCFTLPTLAACSSFKGWTENIF